MRDPQEIMDEMIGAEPMMATTVIVRLQQLVDRHGDLPVILADRDAGLHEIHPYDADGNTIGTPIEIGLHGW